MRASLCRAKYGFDDFCHGVSLFAITHTEAHEHPSLLHTSGKMDFHHQAVHHHHFSDRRFIVLQPVLLLSPVLRLQPWPPPHRGAGL